MTIMNHTKCKRLLKFSNLKICFHKFVLRPEGAVQADRHRSTYIKMAYATPQSEGKLSKNSPDRIKKYDTHLYCRKVLFFVNWSDAFCSHFLLALKKQGGVHCFHNSVM